MNKKRAGSLRGLLSKYKQKEYKKTVFVTDLPEVARLLAALTPETDFDPAWKDGDREFAAALKLIHDVIINKEMNRRPGYLSLSQGQRDGQDCMNFLFDLINECAGYTSKYYDEIGAGKLNYQQMVKKYRAERNDPQGSELLADRYPHCLLVLEGVHRLFRMY